MLTQTEMSVVFVPDEIISQGTNGSKKSYVQLNMDEYA